MTNSIDHLAGNTLLFCSEIENFALDAKYGRLDNIEQLSARVDLAMEAIQELHRLVGELEQELTVTIDNARAL